MDGAVEGLPGEGLLMDVAVGRAVEKAADAVFELAHDLRRVADERPSQVLVVEEGAALDGVLEMRLYGIVRMKDDVIAALHHARAAALAE